MKKLIDLPENLIDLIQEFADKNCEGNFSMAVRMILLKGVNDGNQD